jgi:hypothetical protein
MLAWLLPSLRVVEVADERVCEVDLSGGLVAVTLEAEPQPAFVN